MSGEIMLTIDEQITHCKSKGITFHICNEDKAKNYLDKHNTYFRIRAYRKNFSKNGKGEYVNLDFGHLLDLSIIDFEFRRILLDMALNIEHYSKLKIINYVLKRKPGDAYYLIKNFIGYRPNIKSSLINQKRSPYDEDLYNKFGAPEKMPIWVFVEFLSFSELIQLINYSSQYFQDKDLESFGNQLYDIKAVRNACAHDNCLLNDIVHNNRTSKVSYLLSTALGKISIKKSTQKSKLSNRKISQIASVLYFHTRIVESPGLQKHVSLRLNNLRNRFFRDNTFDKNLSLRTTFEFFSKIIDNWYKVL